MSTRKTRKAPAGVPSSGAGSSRTMSMGKRTIHATLSTRRVVHNGNVYCLVWVPRDVGSLLRDRAECKSPDVTSHLPLLMTVSQGRILAFSPTTTQAFLTHPSDFSVDEPVSFAAPADVSAACSGETSSLGVFQEQDLFSLCDTSDTSEFGMLSLGIPLSQPLVE